MKNNNVGGFDNRKNKYPRIKLICYLLIILSLNNLIDKNSPKSNNNTNKLLVTMDNYETNDIYNLIYSSPYLTQEEKDYLYNQDFITDYLSCIKESYLAQSRVYSHFNNLKIEGYNEENAAIKNTNGYYINSAPETIYIKNYDKFDDKYKDTIAHEFIHLCQDMTCYNLITEACAEIISEEYYKDTFRHNYLAQVKIIKKLMEIIGSEPIWNYIFTGDFSLIETRVQPFLSKSEYQEFLKDLVFDMDNMEVNEARYQSLNNLLAKLYQNIYHQNIKDDIIISLIDKNDYTLVRYYFNHRYINEENSYYIDYSQSTYETFSYEEALKNNLINIYATTNYELTIDEALKLIEEGTKKVYRQIDKSSNSIIIYGKTESYNKSYISAKINGVDYVDTDIDELAKEGIIKVDYYALDSKELTYEEYINKNYNEDDYITISSKLGLKVSEDSICGYIPKKIFLPTIAERFEDSNIKTKKYEK